MSSSLKMQTFTVCSVREASLALSGEHLWKRISGMSRMIHSYYPCWNGFSKRGDVPLRRARMSCACVITCSLSVLPEAGPTVWVLLKCDCTQDMWAWGMTRHTVFTAEANTSHSPGLPLSSETECCVARLGRSRGYGFRCVRILCSMQKTRLGHWGHAPASFVGRRVNFVLARIFQPFCFLVGSGRHDVAMLFHVSG